MIEHPDATWPARLSSLILDLTTKVDRLTRAVGDLERQIDEASRQ